MATRSEALANIYKPGETVDSSGIYRVQASSLLVPTSTLDIGRAARHNA